MPPPSCRLACVVFAAVVALGSLATGFDDPQAALLKTFHSEFITITPGKGQFPKSFQMGTKSEQPVHEVTFNHSFAIAKYEIPQNLYESVVGINPSKWKGKRNSVEMLTATQARDFCKQVTDLLRDAKLITADEEIRLPTEAEWEYCCRAGTKTAYSFGDIATKPGDKGAQASILGEYGWHHGNASGNDPPVGALKPNAWGLYDMHGYLWEFVTDAWHDDYAKAPHDGSAWTSPDPDSATVLRSGSWKDQYPRLTSTARRKIAADEVGDEVGFRCVKAKQVAK